MELISYFQKWTPEEQRRLMARMRSLGVMIDMLSGLQASFATPDRLRSSRSGSKHIAVSPRTRVSSDQHQVGSSARWSRSEGAVCSRAVENLKRASDIAEKSGINIVIEPIDLIENRTIFLTSVHEGFQIVRGGQSS